MIKSSHRRYIALMMLLAFISQIMASAAMTCDLQKAFASGPNSIYESQIDHSTHDMSHVHESSKHESMQHEFAQQNSLHDKTNQSADLSYPTHHQSFCCKTMAHCLLGCALITLNSNFLFQLVAINSGVEDFYSSTASNPFIPSLYRPPILI